MCILFAQAAKKDGDKKAKKNSKKEAKKAKKEAKKEAKKAKKLAKQIKKLEEEVEKRKRQIKGEVQAANSLENASFRPPHLDSIYQEPCFQEHSFKPCRV